MVSWVNPAWVGDSSSLGEFPNKAWPWIFVSMMPSIPVLFAVALVLVWARFPPAGSVEALSDVGFCAELAVGLGLAGAGLTAWLFSYRAPRALTISEWGVYGTIRVSPMLSPTKIAIPFDKIRTVYFFFPAWAVRSTQLTGGVWFVYLSRQNATRVQRAWLAWKGAYLRGS
jgi:hypothetical protein